MKKFLLINLLSLSFLMSNAQALFERTFGTVYYYEYGFDAIQQSDSSYLLLGLYDFGVMKFIKFSKAGNLIWDHTVATVPNSSYYYLSEPTPNNFYVCSNGQIRKFDLAGTTQVLAPYSMGFDQRLSYVSNDSGLIGLGNATLNGLSKVVMIKYNKMAVVQRRDTLDFDSIYSYSGSSIKQLSDGNFVIFGSKEIGGFSAGYEFIKADSAGNVIWQSNYNNDSIIVKDFIATNDSGFVLAGVNPLDSFKLMIKRFNAFGNLVGDYTLLPSNGLYRFQISQTRDNGFIIGCDIHRPGSFDMDLYVAKISANGMYQWSRNFGGTHYDYMGSVRQTLDEGYIICGAKFIPGNNDDYFLIKMDSVGNTDPLLTEAFVNSLEKDEFSVYPNPTSSNLTISTSEKIKEIKVFNLLGEEKLTLKLNEKEATLNLRSLVKGIYTVEIITENSIRIKKVLKE